MTLLLIGTALALASVKSHAQSTGFRPYVEGYVAGGGISVEDLDFVPFFAGITAGVFLRPGIGLEVHADGPLSAGEDGGFDLTYENAFGIAARFQSPPQRGVSGYVVLGYTQFSLEQESDGVPVAGADIDEDFGSGRLSIGLSARLTRLPRVSITAEFRRLFTNGSLDVDAFVLGVRFGRQ